MFIGVHLQFFYSSIFINFQTQRYLVYWANFKLLAEFSTIFLNLRWALSTVNMKKKKLYFVNGLCLTASFFLCRIMLIPIFYNQVLGTIFTSVYKASMSRFEHYSWLLMSLTLDFLNIVWFRKLMRGVFKHLESDKLAKKN